MADFLFEGTNGAAATGGPGNTGLNSVTLGAGTAATFSNAHPHSGTTGLKFAGVSGQNCQGRGPLTSNPKLRYRMYFWYSGSNPAFGEQFFAPRNTGKSHAWNLNTASKLELSNTTNVVVFTAAAALPSAGLYRIEAYANDATSLTFAYYSGDSLTAIQSSSVSAQSFNTGNFATFDLGRMSTGAAAYDVYIDDVTVETSATNYSSFLGPYVAPSNFDVIIGVGQSNMRGAASDFDYPTTDFYDANVYQWNGTTNSIIPATEPLWNGDGTAFMGVVNRFVRSYVAGGQLTGGRKILIVMTARGGTGFSRPDSNAGNMTWQIDDAGGTNLYDASKVIVAAAMTAASTGSVVKAVLANHGSTDGINNLDKPTYKSRVNAFIDAYRSWLTTQTYAPANVMYVMMQMRPDLLAAETRHLILDEAQQELAASKVHVRHTLSPVGDEYEKADAVHFNALGVRTIGASMYTKYMAADPAGGYDPDFADLVALGYTGSLSNMRRQSLLSLLSLTEPQGTNNDLELRYWRSVGKTGSLQDARHQP